MKGFISLVTALVTPIALTFSTFGNTAHTEKGLIIKADRFTNEWQVLDTNNQVWSFSDGEDLFVGDLVKVTFSDDEITNVEYLGYWSDNLQ